MSARIIIETTSQVSVGVGRRTMRVMADGEVIEAVCDPSLGLALADAAERGHYMDVKISAATDSLGSVVPNSAVVEWAERSAYEPTRGIVFPSVLSVDRINEILSEVDGLP